MRSSPLPHPLEEGSVRRGADARLRAVLERRDAQRAVCDPLLERHRRVDDQRRGEAPVTPGLQRVADVESEQGRHLVVVEAARRADLDEQRVDVRALEARVAKRRRHRLISQRRHARVA